MRGGIGDVIIYFVVFYGDKLTGSPAVSGDCLFSFLAAPGGGKLMPGF